MKIPLIIFLFCGYAFITFLCPTAYPQGIDIKGCVDNSLHYLRELQNSDGSYGPLEKKENVTSLVLLAFGTSHRRYTELDGPFIRKAVEWQLSRQTPEGLIDGTTLSGTALSLAGITAVNKLGRKEVLNKGLTWFIDGQLQEESQWENFLNRPTLFHLILFLRLYNSDALTNRSCPSGEVSPHLDSASIYNALWHVFLGKELSEALEWEKLISDIEYALAENPSRTDETMIRSLLSDDALWAGIYLLSLQQEKSKEPIAWADRIAPALIGKLQRLIENEERENIQEVALLTNALSLCLGKITSGNTYAMGDEQSVAPIVATPHSQKEAASAALAFLSGHQKEGRFGFDGFPDPGISALVLSAVLRTTRWLEMEEPSYVESGLEYLKSLQKEDGSIYQHGLANYVTSSAIMAFVDSGRPEYQSVIDSARNFLVRLQADEGEGYSLEEDPFYGGLGYGGDERPDLSNTQMSIEALKAADLDEEHDAYRKAILFLQKCRNYPEVNPTKIQIGPGDKVISGNDGGGIYAPGTSKADLEEIDDGVFIARSYGSMTYALLKSYLFAGLDPNDKRVQAAVKWIQENYTLDENPGFKNLPGRNLGQQGLYYYYLTMAKALDALGNETLEGPDNKTLYWRPELERKILELQRTDGSWLNDRSPRWFEGNPVLATAYALLVLDVCRER